MNSKKRSIAWIVTYARQHEEARQDSALGWYSLNLLKNFSSKMREKIIIISDISLKNKKRFYQQKLLVDECWHRSRLSFLKDILVEIQKYPNIEIVHIQHEFNQFGKLISISLSILLFFWLKIILKKKIIFTLHGIVSLSIINRDFLKSNNLPFFPAIIKILFFIIYRIIINFADHIIVHEKYFKDVLVREYKCNKDISIVHIGVKKEKGLLNKNIARKMLQISPKLKVILYFGFLAGYKGIDLLIDTFKAFPRNTYYLIIAGGKPERLKNSPVYNTWYQQFCRKISDIPNIRVTGFLPDKELEKYFKATDLTVFPYLAPISASGALAMAIAYNVPFIVSDSFGSYINKKYVFKKTIPFLRKKIKEFFSTNPIEYSAYMKFLQNDRNWKISAKKTERIYENINAHSSF